MGCEGGYPGTVLTEHNWNDEGVKICKEKGAAAPGPTKYLASKPLAERAFWDFMKNDKPEFDGVSVLPSVVLGPWEQFSAHGAVAGSTMFTLPFINPDKPATTDMLEHETWNIVDVRDVAQVIVKALAADGVAGERFIVAAEPLWGNDFALGARALNRPGLNKGNDDPAYRASLDKKSTHTVGAKAAKTLVSRTGPRTRRCRTRSGLC